MSLLDQYLIFLDKPSHAKIQIFDVNGQEVTTLGNTYYQAGIHDVEWNAITTGSNKISSEIYQYRLVTKWGTKTNSMLFIK